MKKTINTKFRFFSLLLIILSFFFTTIFTSCENNLATDGSTVRENQYDTEKSGQSDKGKVQIRINPDQLAGNGNSRTVFPEITYDTISSISLRGTRNGITSNLYSWSSYYDVGYVMIELGTWELQLIVVNNGKSFTSELETVIVESGLVKNVTFTLSTTSTEGGINLHIDFDDDDNAVAASYTLYNYPSDTEETSGILNITTSPSKSVNFIRNAATNPIAIGTYRIEINFWADADRSILLNTYSEIIRVKGGFTSSASRYIDLNNLYTITYDADGGSILTGSYVNNYSLHSGTIDLPTLRRTGYEFVGWYKDSGLTDGPVTEFNVNTETSLTDKNFYAKWNRVCAITYYLANQAATADSDCIELTEDQCEEWGLVQSHKQGENTELPTSPINNENNVEITLAGYKLNSLNGTALTISGSKYIIPSTISTDTKIYVSVKSHIAYIDPSITSDENNISFNPSTPAKTVATALKWLYNTPTADSDGNSIIPVLYVKSAISNKTDIENLSGLSLNEASGGLYGAAIVKRHDSFTNGSLLSITENLTLQNVTLDGGAVWSKTQTEIEADPELLVTRTNSGLSSSIYLISTSTGSTGTATFEGVTIQNVDNTATTNNGNGAAVYINSGTLTLTDCQIKDCRSIRGAIFASMAGKINAVNTRFLCNNSIGSGSDKGHGGAVYLYGGTTSGGQATFDACSFQYNAANAFGGAVYVGNNAKTTFKNQGSNSLANNFSDMATAAASRTCKGDFVYTRGTLTLLGDFVFGTGDNALSFYIDNASSQHPIILGDSFGGASTTGTAKIYLSQTLENSLNQSVLAVVFGDSSVDMANAKMHFALAENDGNYLIDDDGFIKLIPGTVTATPGFPGNYVCKWKQRVNGTTRYIDLIIEDLEEHALEIGTAVGNINSVTAGIYEGADLVKEYTLTSATGLSFAYPSSLDPPSGTPFYVKFNVKVDDTTAYSYDYWPEQFLIGSKPKPDAVGDIVFNDGSAMAYTDFENITDTSVKNTKKAFAIALIFYKGTSESDVLGVRTLGVGLKHNQSGLAWCLNGVNAYSKNITTIQCTPSGSAGALTFTGDKDGSNNLEQIEDFEGVNDTTTAANYPAFYFGKNYATNTVTNIEATSEFATGWYLPSIAELFQIYACRVDSIIGFDIGAASQALGGDSFGTSNYWSSSQSAANDVVAYKLNFHDGDWEVFNKGSNLNYVCCIRAF